MHRLARFAVAALLVVSAFSALLIAAGCGGPVSAEAVPAASPSPPPAWLLEAAKAQAARWGDPHPTAAYWGLLHDPQLGDLTASGPDDPSHKAYAIVLVGDFDALKSQISYPGPEAAAADAKRHIKWAYWLYTADTHVDGGSFGFGPHAFDASRYPDLQPFSW
jgi:hypothetical protein